MMNDECPLAISLTGPNLPVGRVKGRKKSAHGSIIVHRYL